MWVSLSLLGFVSFSEKKNIRIHMSQTDSCTCSSVSSRSTRPNSTWMQPLKIYFKKMKKLISAGHRGREKEKWDVTDA